MKILSHLKRAGAFYLGSWWLPPLLPLLWTILGMVLMIDKGKSEEPIEVRELANAVGAVLWWTVLLWLGWSASWIWLLSHKRWMRALLSFLLIVLLYGLQFFNLLNPPSP